MTGILLGCLAVILLAGALYVLIVREDIAAAIWYRMFHDPDPYDSCFAAAPDIPPPYDRALDPVDEHFKSSPRVVAGSDIDRLLAIRQAETDATFDALVGAQLADLDAYLSDFYVLPEGDR